MIGRYCIEVKSLHLITLKSGGSPPHFKRMLLFNCCAVAVRVDG